LRGRILTCLAAVVGSSAVDRLASAGTLFVDANLATGANDGSSWVDAFQGSGGLQSALALAALGDEIWVADRMASSRFRPATQRIRHRSRLPAV
jgi:hypothetical protein